MIPTRSHVFQAVVTTGTYEVYIYDNVLASRLTIYEIYKPFTPLPYSFILDSSRADIRVFHDLVGSDEFNDDNYFIGMLWMWLHDSPFRRGDLDISLEEEPHMFRRNADDIIFNMEQKKMAKLFDRALEDSFVGR